MHEKCIRDTADCENCAQKPKCKGNCPNYIETFWHEEGQQQPTLVKDCAPKRTMLMLQELYNRCYGMQVQINQAEAEVSQQRCAITKLLEAFEYARNEKVLEDSARAKLNRHMSSMKYCEPDKFIKLPEEDKKLIG